MKGAKIMNVYSEENLKGLVFDLIKYLYSVKDYVDGLERCRLSENVLIYTMNRIYYVDEKNPNFKIGKIPIHIEENVDVEEYFDYCDKDTLTLSMDSILCEYLYYGDFPGASTVIKKVNNIFEKHGFDYEFGSSWYIYAVPLKEGDN